MIQAITIDYHGSSIVPATPQIVYRAVRVSLEKAELFRLSSVATYLMAIRPTYGTEAPGVMAGALCRALLDHAAVTSSISRIVVAEQILPKDNVDRVTTAVNALRSAYATRWPAQCNYQHLGKTTEVLELKTVEITRTGTVFCHSLSFP